MMLLHYQKYVTTHFAHTFSTDNAIINGGTQSMQDIFTDFFLLKHCISGSKMDHLANHMSNCISRISFHDSSSPQVYSLY